MKNKANRKEQHHYNSEVFSHTIEWNNNPPSSPMDAESPRLYVLRRNKQSEKYAPRPSLSRGVMDCDHSSVEFTAWMLPMSWLNSNVVSAAVIPVAPNTYFVAEGCSISTRSRLSAVFFAVNVMPHNAMFRNDMTVALLCTATVLLV